MTILIVEDDKTIGDLLKMYFCGPSHGHDCDTAHGINEAKEMLLAKHYDVVVLDLLLDGEFCTPLIDFIHHIDKDRQPNICMMSAMTGADKIAKQNKVIFIPKPFSFETIDELVLNKKCK